jgi:hypothetical protein
MISLHINAGMLTGRHGMLAQTNTVFIPLRMDSFTYGSFNQQMNLERMWKKMVMS